MILNEDLTVSPREIDKNTKDILTAFQEILGKVVSFYHDSSEKRGRIKSLKDFKIFKREMLQYAKYPFMYPVLKQIKEIENQIIDKYQATRQINKDKEFSSHLKTAKRLWLSKNPQMAYKYAIPIINFMKNHKISSTSDDDILKQHHNPFYIENPLFFQSTNFLKIFELSEIREVINKDLDIYRYSYMRLPESRHANFQYIAYFILELKKKPVEIALTNNEMRQYFDMSFDDDGYANLVKKVQTYLLDNDKKLLPDILKEMKEFPDIVKANEAAKQKITKVYRGFPDTGNHKPDKFLATSISRNVAKRFALEIGHLESEDNRRSDSGIIITYEVNSEAIVLDTRIFGGIYNEAEIIIDETKAKVIDEEFV